MKSYKKIVGPHVVPKWNPDIGWGSLTWFCSIRVSGLAVMGVWKCVSGAIYESPGKGGGVCWRSFSMSSLFLQQCTPWPFAVYTVQSSCCTPWPFAVYTVQSSCCTPWPFNIKQSNELLSITLEPLEIECWKFEHTCAGSCRVGKWPWHDQSWKNWRSRVEKFWKKRKNDVRFYKFIFGKKRLFQAQNLC